MHSYLSYLRDRLIAARELLADSGSIFVQISEQNLHRVRALADDVFGAQNFAGLIAFSKTTGQTTTLLAQTTDFLLWFAKSIDQIKYRQVFEPRNPVENVNERYVCIESPSGEIHDLSVAQKSGREPVLAV